MESDTLIQIDPPGKDRTPLQVAEEVMNYVRGEYCLSTRKLCQVLLCDRQWIDITFRPVIHHICITHYFREYMLNNLKLTREEREKLSEGFIFYSKKDISEYWKAYGSAERKTKLIDLATYQKGGFTYDLVSELEYHKTVKPNKKEKERHLSKMETLLTSDGFYYYQLSQTTPKDWVSCPLPSFSSSIVLTTLAQERTRFSLNSNASAMQHLIKKGGIRVKLGARALWLVPDTTPYRVPISVPTD